MRSGGSMNYSFNLKTEENPQNSITPRKDTVSRRLFPRMKTPKTTTKRTQKISKSKSSSKNSILHQTRFGSKSKNKKKSIPKLNLGRLSTGLKKSKRKKKKKKSFRPPRRGVSMSSIASNASMFMSRKDLENVTNYEYEPDNSPTKEGFLRNKFNGGRGGSNAHELKEDDSLKIYYALPKDFYDREYASGEKMVAGSRHVKPDYRGSRLEGPIEQSVFLRELSKDRNSFGRSGFLNNSGGIFD